MKTRAFTIVEILCVIAIIACLAALSFPAFARARLSASDVVCTSNLRQLYIAIELYRQDHEGGWPNLNSTGLPDIHHTMRIGRQMYGDHACKWAPWGPVSARYPYVYFGRYDLFMGAPTTVEFGLYYSLVGDAGVLLADFNHNEKDIPWMDEDTVIKAKTMTVGGSYRVYRSKGNFFRLPGPFWEDYAKP
jgi:prepilin-type N-terminal cleavage/methylation domain-containing protein